tara:strand:+ start:350 stop:1795 length:1446 start_codon:yes stop_codon:yes gene_type:complete
MNSPFQSVMLPLICDENTDFLPLFEDLVKESKKLGVSRFFSATFETNYIDPLALLEENQKSEKSVCYMEKPSGEFSIACGGFVTNASFCGSNRFQKARNWSDDLFSQTIICGDHKHAGTGPTLFIAATFETDNQGGESPPPLQIFLPRWQVLRKGGSHFLIANLEISPDSSALLLAKELSKIILMKKGVKYDHQHLPKSKSIQFGIPTENFDYKDAVSEALEIIRSEKLSKIVLARQLSYKTSSELPPFGVAHSLRERYPDCFTFCLSTPGQGMMVGATPETLLRSTGSVFETEAIAGSAPRGPTAGRDADWGKKLLMQEKEIHEHRLVIDGILRRLKSIGLSNCKEGKSRLLRLANLQHIRTPVRSNTIHGVHPFEALSALHPTPAMGGTPRNEALPLVRHLEKASRGWYSGVTGWIDARGRGEFVVPIRCGKITSNHLTLYAGAGLVEGSTPEQEKVETDWKLQAMLEVITGETIIPDE